MTKDYLKVVLYMLLDYPFLSCVSYMYCYHAEEYECMSGEHTDLSHTKK